MNSADSESDPPLDLIIIGAGISGVVALHYARQAGLDVLLLERQAVVGGLWARLPPWQDIQFGRLDWTLGDLPIAGEDQASIRDNIQAWVDRFGLADRMRLGTEVTRAAREGNLWSVETRRAVYRARNPCPRPAATPPDRGCSTRPTLAARRSL